MHDAHRLWHWKRRKSRWLALSADDLRAVIQVSGVRERNQPPHKRARYRKRRLEAVALYRRRFGDAAFLKELGGARLSAMPNLWLAGGFAWWKWRKWRGGAV